MPEGCREPDHRDAGVRVPGGGHHPYPYSFPTTKSQCQRRSTRKVWTTESMHADNDIDRGGQWYGRGRVQGQRKDQVACRQPKNYDSMMLGRLVELSLA
eukprot:360907-Hanusia_phi.AAC.1